MFAALRLPMKPYSSLTGALALSIALHAAILFSGARLVSALPPLPRSAEALRVKLLEPLSAPAPQPELRMREDTPPKAVSAPLPKAVPEKRAESRAPVLAARPSASG